MSLSNRIEARYTPCERCGGAPAVHNPHPLNEAYVGHEYTVSNPSRVPEWIRRKQDGLLPAKELVV